MLKKMNESTILVVDDERQIRKLLGITLNSAGYKVVEATTGREGLTMAAMHPPELILLDLGLPDEDGQNILVRLREWYLSPIIILSVRDSEEEIVRALDNGANDYLVKPFSTEPCYQPRHPGYHRAVSPGNRPCRKSKDLW